LSIVGFNLKQKYSNVIKTHSTNRLLVIIKDKAQKRGINGDPEEPENRKSPSSTRQGGDFHVYSWL